MGGDVDEDEVDEEEDDDEVVMSKSMLLLIRLVEFGESELLLSCWISLVFMVIGERGSLVADIIMAEVDDCNCGGDGVRTKLLLLSLIDGEWCCFLSTPLPPLPEEGGDVRDESPPPTLNSAVSFSLLLDVNVEAVDESPQINDGLFLLKLFVVAVDVEAFNVPFLFSNLDLLVVIIRIIYNKILFSFNHH